MSLASLTYVLIECVRGSEGGVRQTGYKIVNTDHPPSFYGLVGGNTR
jgi:hypothetical protein